MLNAGQKLRATAAIAQAIRDLKEVPSGHLYAHPMGVLSLNEYLEIIECLKRAKCVRQEPSHLLVWIGK